MRLRTHLGLGAVVVGLGVVSVASASAPGSEVTRAPNVLRVGHADLGGGPGSPDPMFTPHWARHIDQLRLLAYPDRSGVAGRRLVAEAAERMPRVSRDERTYRFTVRRGLRFSNGTPVTAAHFAFALARGHRPELQSPYVHVGMPIEGVDDVIAGRTTRLSGVTARGRELTVRLTRPDPSFLGKLALVPAIPLGVPTTPGGVRTIVPSAGPYQLTVMEPRRIRVIRNRYWNRRAIPWRPARLDAIEWTIGGTDAERVRMVEQGRLDLVYVEDPAVGARLTRRYGVNRRRHFVKPVGAVWMVSFNHGRRLFRGNARLRRAVNFALDRPRLARQFVAPATPTDQFLPATVPGFRDARLYPLAGPKVARARALARGALRGGRAILYNRSQPPGPRFSQIIRANLERIGLRVEVREFDRTVMLDRLLQRGEPWDMAVYGLGKAPDPQVWIEESFHGRHIRFNDVGRNEGGNLGQFDVPAWNRRIDRAGRRRGNARLAAYSAVERDLMRKAAPVAPFLDVGQRVFVSRRVGCFTWHVEGHVDFVALCKR